MIRYPQALLVPPEPSSVIASIILHHPTTTHFRNHSISDSLFVQSRCASMELGVVQIHAHLLFHGVCFRGRTGGLRNALQAFLWRQFHRHFVFGTRSTERRGQKQTQVSSSGIGTCVLRVTPKYTWAFFCVTVHAGCFCVLQQATWLFHGCAYSDVHLTPYNQSLCAKAPGQVRGEMTFCMQRELLSSRLSSFVNPAHPSLQWGKYCIVLHCTVLCCAVLSDCSHIHIHSSSALSAHQSGHVISIYLNSSHLISSSALFLSQTCKVCLHICIPRFQRLLHTYLTIRTRFMLFNFRLVPCALTAISPTSRQDGKPGIFLWIDMYI